MATNVTVYGSASTPQIVNVPFNTLTNATAAQGALAFINKFIQNGADGVTDVNSSNASALPATSVSVSAQIAEIGASVTALTGSGGSTALIQLPSGYSALIDNSTALAAVAGSQNTRTVVASNNSQLDYYNTFTGAGATVYLGGGSAFIANAPGFNATSLTINEGGPSSTGAGAGGAAFVDGAVGSTTVNMFTVGSGGTPLLSVYQGNVSVVAEDGAVTVQVNQGTGGPNSGSTFVTVSAAASTASINYLPNGGNAFITPGLGNVVVLANTNSGAQGSETLFGGAATIGGIAYSAPTITGTVNVKSGNGYFQGGINGGNILQTSTLAGTATLVGGGNGDQLFAAGSADSIVAGAGNETLSGSSIGGNTFLLGAGVDTLFGDSTGHDRIAFGSGGAVVNLGGFINSTNFLTEIPGVTGGAPTVSGFIPSSLGFGTIDTVQFNAGVTATLSTVGTSALATLSDGTKITFTNTTAGSITNHGSFLT